MTFELAFDAEDDPGVNTDVAVVAGFDELEDLPTGIEEELLTLALELPGTIVVVRVLVS